MRVTFILLALLLGVVLSVHLGMNAQVGSILRNPRMGNAIFWTIGGITAILIGLTAWDPAVFQNLRQVPIWLLTAGAMGAALVFGIAWVIPQIGAGTFFVLLIAGQVITGMILSHFGVLGSPVDPITTMKVVGVLLLVTGAGIVTFAN
jgi:transporter family-2 protein